MITYEKEILANLPKISVFIIISNYLWSNRNPTEQPQRYGEGGLGSA